MGHTCLLYTSVFVLIGGFLFDFISDLIFFILHVTGSGSFPKPLSAKEEKEYLEKLNQGDQNARNTLIEHNLRLVAHIIKKYYANSSDQDDLILSLIHIYVPFFVSA